MRLIFGLIISLGLAPAEQLQMFPPGSLGRDANWDHFMSDQLSSCLQSFHETSIWQASQKHASAEVYRFLWLRSFHPAIAVRLDIAADGSAVLTTKVSNGCCDCPPPPADIKQKRFRVQTDTKSLSQVQVHQFGLHLTSVHFWTLIRQDFGGQDGADWIIEASSNGRYHLVHASSPPSGDPVNALGRFMLSDLAGLHLPNNEIY